ncbi:tetratricopeptide repeat protein [Limnofasciculus baicalensis]|uniref:Tetratricopeptide repeat protein n=1 Tax=Limnofasciculus baicalensis BBK-W-15 TaxID=2699891 RepID=A0AAE3KSA3_9CYAN|nr:tetratricopeptide repeat protein [Limnofasciculus baicalensis]MCP2729272.1 tetratricopeptide repeat protein [Limnofasciculus baicalensis BBK-W-15]
MAETISEPIISSNLEQAIADYAKALSLMAEATSNPSKQQILKILLARDAVAQALPEKTQVSEDSIARLIELDGKLKSQGEAIATYGALAEWQESLEPPKSSWWWFFQPPKITNPWDHYDWLWDTLTAAALVLSGSYMVNTLHNLSVGGLGVLEAFGTIAQAGGIAIVGKGALTSDGKEKVKSTLKKLNIPPHFYSEVTFGLSTLLLLGAYGLHSSLPSWGNYHYKKGQEFYDKGDLQSAENEYLQAIRLDSSNVDIRTNLGAVYESIGDIDKALTEYKHALKFGDPQAMNNISRIYINKNDPVTAETYLRMGLQRVTNDRDKMDLQYQLHRNLGWSLLKQKKYPEAEQELKEAIEIDKKDPKPEDKLPGKGMANCFLAQTLEFGENKERSNQVWSDCKKFAKPETLAEYKWFIDIGKRTLANDIDTSKVVKNPNKDRKNKNGGINTSPTKVKETP